jgi:H+/gluconate symporter-like permease
MRQGLRHYGFALLVLVALAAASHIAANTAIPQPIPDYALQAAAIYRLEVGASFFAAFYLAAMAFVLALSGRGFAEFGAHGFKAEKVVDQAAEDVQQKAFAQQKTVDRRTQIKLKEVRLGIDDAWEKLGSHEQRLERLEERDNIGDSL